MNIEIKGSSLGSFTFKEDKSADFYNKTRLGNRGSATINFESNGKHDEWMKDLINDASPQKYKIEGIDDVKIGDVVRFNCGGVTILIKVTDVKSCGVFTGVCVNE